MTTDNIFILENFKIFASLVKNKSNGNHILIPERYKSFINRLVKDFMLSDLNNSSKKGHIGMYNKKKDKSKMTKYQFVRLFEFFSLFLLINELQATIASLDSTESKSQIDVLNNMIVDKIALYKS